MLYYVFVYEFKFKIFTETSHYLSYYINVIMYLHLCVYNNVQNKVFVFKFHNIHVSVYKNLDESANLGFQSSDMSLMWNTY